MDLSVSPHVSGLPSGFWNGTGGFLRQSVDVSRTDSHWRLGHSLWEVEIPNGRIDDDPGLRAFLERRKPMQDVEFVKQASRELVDLLLLQGCLTFDGTQESYTLDEVRYLVGS